MKTNPRLYLLVLGIVLISVGLTGTTLSRVYRQEAKDKATQLLELVIENVPAPHEKGTSEYERWKEFQVSSQADLISEKTHKTNRNSSMILAAGIGLTFSMSGAIFFKKKRGDNQAVDTTPVSAPR